MVSSGEGGGQGGAGEVEHPHHCVQPQAHHPRHQQHRHPGLTLEEEFSKDNTLVIMIIQ